MNNQNYEKARQECWDTLRKELLDGEVQWQPVSRKDIFNFAFDRAYALDKEKETITQGEIEKAAIDYIRTNPFVNSRTATTARESFVDGANFALGKQEKDADTVISGWVAIDDDGDMFLYRTRPARDETAGYWMSDECPLDVGINLFPDLSWESDPEQIEIIIKRKKK